MEDIFKISVSKAKTFDSCKAKYKFNYIDKLPKKTWAHHILGNLVHVTLENFHKYYIYIKANDIKNYEPFNKVMTNAFKDACIKYEGNITPETYSQAREMLLKYLDKINIDTKSSNGLPNVIAVEQDFAINIQNKVLLNGAIDRIELEPNDVYHVCDYKTTKDKKYLKNDFFQLLVYAYVIKKIYPQAKKVKGSYIMLRHDFERFTQEFTDAQILSVEKKITDLYSDILEEKLWRAQPTMLCSYCDFMENCDEGKKLVYPHGTPSINPEMSW